MNSRSDWRCSKAYNETAFRVFVLDRVCMSQRFSAFDWWFYVETVPGSFARFLIFLFIFIFTSIWRSFDGSFSPTFLHFAFPQHVCILQRSSIWFVILRPKARFFFFSYFCKYKVLSKDLLQPFRILHFLDIFACYDDSPFDSWFYVETVPRSLVRVFFLFLSYFITPV